MTPIPERPVAVPRPVLGDPRAVPVVGTDAQLPPLPVQRLTPGFLRERQMPIHTRTDTPQPHGDRPSSTPS